MSIFSRKSSANPQCPNCGTYKTASIRAMTFTFGIVLCMLVITAPLGVLIIFAGFFQGKKKMRCWDCGHRFMKE